MELKKCIHKRIFGNIICPHCMPSLAHQLTPRATVLRLPSPALHGIPSPGPLMAGLQVDTSSCHCQSSSTDSVNPSSSFMIPMLFPGLPGHALFPQSPHSSSGPFMSSSSEVHSFKARVPFSLNMLSPGCSHGFPGI